MFATCATLTAVLAAAAPGDIIEMQPETCNSIRILRQKIPAPGVTINAQGVRFLSLWIDHSAGLNFKGGTYEGREGAFAEGGLRGYGAQIVGSERISISDATFTNALKGLVIKSNSSDIKLDRLNIHGMGGDGVSIAWSERVSLTNSRMSNFLENGKYHQDAVQVWASNDVLIRGNDITGRAMGITDHGGRNDPPNLRTVIEYNSVVVDPDVTITARATRDAQIRFNNVRSTGNPHVTIRFHEANLVCGNSSPKQSAATLGCRRQGEPLLP